MVMAAAAIAMASCTKKPSAEFTADRTSVTEGESVQFSDLSTGEPTVWEWTFDGGTPSRSQEQDPLVTYSSEGIYSVTLEVRNRGGSDVITKSGHITVEPATTDLVFVNNTYTEMVIEVLGVVRTIASGEQTTYRDLEGASVSYNAETSGTSSSGDQIGTRLYWTFDVSLEGGTVTRELSVGTDYFFLFVTNSGTRGLSPLYVNDGGDQIWEEQIYLPADGTNYRIGYYLAWDGTEVRAIWEDQPSQYTYWVANQHFTYPNELNQKVELTNTFKKGAKAPEPPVSTETRLIPADGFRPATSRSEITVIDLPNRSDP